MELNKQVCSLELAKQLKELRVEQESFWYWGYYEPARRWDIIDSGEAENWDYPRGVFSAFTVAELGEMLPAGYISVSKILIVNTPIISGTSRFRVKYIKDDNENYEEDDTEADARAKMLIYLIKEKLIKL